MSTAELKYGWITLLQHLHKAGALRKASAVALRDLPDSVSLPTWNAGPASAMHVPGWYRGAALALYNRGYLNKRLAPGDCNRYWLSPAGREVLGAKSLQEAKKRQENPPAPDGDKAAVG